ncbi:Dimeric alpha-beta barrel [Cordyceps fumosorosea ARSEF 2679]|uniref:Dimeric alpha-beta barrel n=1 Tax=Cordyceps fumosorosea (strain ARSEF 2679) TaxID=1081104 RepID=A0A167PNG7_CORFA|nr:Dimeric alpha-beta barrel [Cordyceps fumosorosea ARSEF 2679]OAA56851.1 Dimeric alpha-beta barrel [Cordyceps fumosorosea ARSEF 2679]
MSTSSTPAKFEFLVIVPDKPGTLQKRLEVRATHLANVKPLVANGTYKMGGAVLNSVPEGADPSAFDFHGSSLVAVAESKEAVLEQLKNDIYVTSGVWDLEKAQIFPFICAFRTAKE